MTWAEVKSWMLNLLIPQATPLQVSFKTHIDSFLKSEGAQDLPGVIHSKTYEKTNSNKICQHYRENWR